MKKLIQIVASDPGFEVLFLYDNGEVLRWYWKHTPAGFIRLFEVLEIPELGGSTTQAPT